MLTQSDNDKWINKLMHIINICIMIVAWYIMIVNRRFSIITNNLYFAVFSTNQSSLMFFNCQICIIKWTFVNVRKKKQSKIFKIKLKLKTI